MIDEKIAKAVTLVDAKARAAAYADLQKVVRDEAPWVFLYHPVDHRICQPWVRGFHMHPVWAVRFEQLWIEP